MADAESIRGAILNLVRNALQAAPRATGRVRLSALAAGRDVSIRIEDNGPGVPEGQREEIFAPFFTTKQKGTGLGLALVQKTIRAHQGTIRVEESTLGGATFVVSLPAATS